MSGRLTGSWRWKLTLFGKMRLEVQEVFDTVDRYGNPDIFVRWREPVATDMGLVGAVFVTPEQYAEGKRLAAGVTHWARDSGCGTSGGDDGHFWHNGSCAGCGAKYR